MVCGFQDSLIKVFNFIDPSEQRDIVTNRDIYLAEYQLKAAG